MTVRCWALTGVAGESDWLAAGEVFDRAGHGGQLRVVVFFDTPPGSFAECLDEVEEVQ